MGRIFFVRDSSVMCVNHACFTRGASVFVSDCTRRRICARSPVLNGSKIFPRTTCAIIRSFCAVCMQFGRGRCVICACSVSVPSVLVRQKLAPSTHITDESLTEHAHITYKTRTIHVCSTYKTSEIVSGLGLCAVVRGMFVLCQ